MPKEQLKGTLQDLRLKLQEAQFRHENSRDLAEQRLADLEEKLVEESFMSGDEYLVQELKEQLEEFEEDHPDITMLVGRISDLLAKMGI